MMHPDDELASLRRLMGALESGSMKLLLNGRDVTQEEVARLKPDIEYLELSWRESAAPERAMRKGSGIRRCDRGRRN
jgi:hypothetical protein